MLLTLCFVTAVSTMIPFLNNHIVCVWEPDCAIFSICLGKCSLFLIRKLKPWDGLSPPTSCECLVSVFRMKRVSCSMWPHTVVCSNDQNVHVTLRLPAGPSPRFLIIMEYCDKGSLRQVLDSDCRLSWTRKACMCLDAAKGLYRSVIDDSSHHWFIHRFTDETQKWEIGAVEQLCYSQRLWRDEVQTNESSSDLKGNLMVFALIPETMKLWVKFPLVVVLKVVVYTLLKSISMSQTFICRHRKRV